MGPWSVISLFAVAGLVVVLARAVRLLRGAVGAVEDELRCWDEVRAAHRALAAEMARTSDVVDAAADTVAGRADDPPAGRGGDLVPGSRSI